MIPYEELCAALDRYTAQHQGDAHVHTGETAFPPPDPATSEHLMPPAGLAAGADDEHTNVGLQPIYDDRSNELDIGDVLSDEEAPKNKR